jgi:hypothetical protein
MTNSTPPKPNTQPTTPEAPQTEPSPLADSVTVKANSAIGSLNKCLNKRVPEGCVVHSF